MSAFWGATCELRRIWLAMSPRQSNNQPCPSLPSHLRRRVPSDSLVFAQREPSVMDSRRGTAVTKPARRLMASMRIWFSSSCHKTNLAPTTCQTRVARFRKPTIGNIRRGRQDLRLALWLLFTASMNGRQSRTRKPATDALVLASDDRTSCPARIPQSRPV